MNGDIYVMVDWAGDVWQASGRTRETKNSVSVSLPVPEEGAVIFFDIFAMSTDAKNGDEAYQFLDYLLRLDMVVYASDHVSCTNANKATTPLIGVEVHGSPGTYPPTDVRVKLFTLKVQGSEIDRMRTRAWTKVKSGK